MVSDSEQAGHALPSEEAHAVLTRVIRVMFPHPSFPDAPYERTADIIIDSANGAVRSRTVLEQGLLALTQLAGGDFRALDDDAATGVLSRITGTEFFALVRSTAVVKLYDDHEVWEALGYEGPSFDQGGYINRGFNDLDWLPEPRITLYDGPEPLVEVAPSVALSAAAGEDPGQPDDSGNIPGVAPTRMTEVGQ